MSKKRPSLAELAKVEMGDQPAPASVSAPAKAKGNPKTKSSIALVPPPSEQPQAASQSTSTTYSKLSVTLPEEMHEQLLDLSRERRRAKQPYQLSQLVREALTAWLPSDNNSAT